MNKLPLDKLPVRKRILFTATRLFYRQGIKNTGINQIIAESNVAKASFYQYFPSKDKLILACLDEYNLLLSRILKRMSAHCQSVIEFFKKWTRLIKSNAMTNEFFMGCPIANIGFQVEPGDAELNAKFNEIINCWFEILRPLFEKSVRQGEIPENADLKHLFIEIFTVNEGTLLMWRLTGKKEYLDNIFQSILKIMQHIKN
jgi:TetR/AcrR family transcriptional repressor of lmrAB and yxaGH operons